MLFLLFPSTPHRYTPLAAAVLTVVGSVAYATSIVCSNAFLPGLAKGDEKVSMASRAMVNSDDVAERRMSFVEETERLLASAVRADPTSDLFPPTLEPGPDTPYSTSLSLSTSRLSSTGTALGFLSGLVMLIALIVPVTLLHGTTASLQLAIGLSGVWWAVFTVPAWYGLPGGDREGGGKAGSRTGLVNAWRRVGGMVRWSEMKALPNLYTFLLAWIFLSDGMWSFHFPEDG